MSNHLQKSKQGMLLIADIVPFYLLLHQIAMHSSDPNGYVLIHIFNYQPLMDPTIFRNGLSIPNSPNT